MHVDPIPALQALAACHVPGLDVTGVVDAAHRSRQLRGWPQTPTPSTTRPRTTGTTTNHGRHRYQRLDGARLMSERRTGTPLDN
jgi:hypothetical protein